MRIGRGSDVCDAGVPDGKQTLVSRLQSPYICSDAWTSELYLFSSGLHDVYWACAQCRYRVVDEIGANVDASAKEHIAGTASLN